MPSDVVVTRGPVGRNRHPVNVHVGERLRQRRQALGMSQSRLADALGLSVQQLRKYESGASTIAASRLLAVSRLLGVSPGYFFDGPAAVAGHRTAVVQTTAGAPTDTSDLRQVVAAFRSIASPRVRRHLITFARGLGETD